MLMLLFQCSCCASVVLVLCWCCASTVLVLLALCCAVLRCSCLAIAAQLELEQPAPATRVRRRVDMPARVHESEECLKHTPRSMYLLNLLLPGCAQGQAALHKVAAAVGGQQQLLALCNQQSHRLGADVQAALGGNMQHQQQLQQQMQMRLQQQQQQQMQMQQQQQAAAAGQSMS